jgi:hypothetical protein
MNAVLMTSIMIGVAWLVFWVATDHSKPSKTWWPFAMRGSLPKPPVEQGWRGRRTAAVQRHASQGEWRRSGS